MIGLRWSYCATSPVCAMIKSRVRLPKARHHLGPLRYFDDAVGEDDLRDVAEGLRPGTAVVNDQGDLRRLLWSKRTANDLASISITWTLLLISIAIAQTLNYRLGFAVWPMGEDRVWIDILQNHSSLGAAKAFWQVNDRNPLAPWWYIAIEPLILRYDAGLFAVRMIVGLLLAFTTYLFLITITQARIFALGVACVVAVFLANGYIDNIYWTMHVALICSFCSLVLYKLFLNTHSIDHRFYIGSVVVWLIALGTYSIQSGAMLAIAFLALIAPAPTLIKRFQRAAADTLPFAILFIIFWLEWQTTSRTLYLERPHLLAGISSVYQAFWHFDYRMFFNSVAYVDRSDRLFFFGAAALIGSYVFYRIARVDQQGILPCPLRSLLEATILIGCLMLPVVAVEASGYGIIGEAWRKVYQFTIPFLYLSIVAALFALLPGGVARIPWCIIVALLAAIAAAATLGINRIQVEVTLNEKAVRAALRRFAEENAAYGRVPPYHFLIRREPGFIWYSSDFLSVTYARTWFPSPVATFRFFPRGDTGDSREYLRFTDDGVENAALDRRTISDKNVFLLSAGREGIRRLCRIGPTDLAIPFIEWQRSTDWVSAIGDCAQGR